MKLTARLLPFLGFLMLVFLTGACGESASPETPPTKAPETHKPDKSETPSVPEKIETYEGIDVSHNQGEVKWDQVKAAGKQFVFIKATEGNDYLDPKFKSNWEGAKAAGLPRGAYQFFHPGDDPQTQADFFIKNVKLEANDLAPVVDIEHSDAVSVTDIQKELQSYLDILEQAYGIKPILYSGQNFLDTEIPHGFGSYPLWIAEYPKKGEVQEGPKTPSQWKDWTFWQYSSSGAVNGIAGHVDLNRFKGTQAQWKALLIRETKPD